MQNKTLNIYLFCLQYVAIYFYKYSSYYCCLIQPIIIMERVLLKASQNQPFEEKTFERLMHQLSHQRLNKLQLQSWLNGEIRLEKLFWKLSKESRFITQLYLQNNTLSNRTVQIICKGNWKFITNLNLYNTCITDQALNTFSETSWEFLKTLNLGNNKLKNKSTSYLAKCDFSRLQYFLFNQTSITSQGFKNLQKLHLPKIKFASFCETELLTVDLGFLAKSSWGKLLKIDIHIKDEYNSFLWCNVMAKFPRDLSEIQINVFDHQIKENSIKAITNLSYFYEYAHQLDYVWQQAFGVGYD